MGPSRPILAVAAAAAVALAAALPGCGHASAPPPADRGAPVSVSTVAAEERPLTVLYRASGTVRGRNTAILTSKATGNVRAVRVRPGDAVTAGQPLVEIEANDVRASVARARAGLDQSMASRVEAEGALEAARVAARTAKSRYDRAVKLLADRTISQQDFDADEARFQSATAQEQMAAARLRAMGASIDESRAALGEAQATLGHALVTAPFAGRVLERRVDPGTLASPGTPLLVIVDEGTLRVEASVDESRASEVKLGDEAELEVEAAAARLTGKITEIVPSVDVASRAFLVKIDLPRELGGLRPGTFARVGFRVGARPALVVPTSALTSFGALDRVFVVAPGAEGGATARLRMVTRGEAQGPHTEVLSGLSKGEVVVTGPPAALRDGAPIETRR